MAHGISRNSAFEKQENEDLNNEKPGMKSGCRIGTVSVTELCLGQDGALPARNPDRCDPVSC